MLNIEKVKSSAKEVSENAENVFICNDKIAEYVDFFWDKYKDSLITELSDDIHYITDDKEKTLSYILLLNAIDFGSNKFIKAAKPIKVDLSYNTIASSLKRAFKDGKLDTAERWANATPVEVADMLSIAGEDEENAEELSGLLNLFLDVIHDVGKTITSRYGGEVVNLISECRGSAVKLVELLTEFDCFNDSCTYKDKEVVFLKRAQITVACMNLVYKCFPDIGELTIVADNIVSHVLHCDGLLKYNEGLALKIENGLPIETGSDAEIEIRASSIYVVELMTEEAKKKGYDITAVDMDFVLWHRGHDDPEIANRKSHITTDANA